MTLEQALAHCRDNYNYPQVFDINCGLDVIIPELKLHAEKAWKDKRSVTLEISSFQGMCSDAIHFYGKIHIRGVNMVFDEKPNSSTFVDGDKYPLGGYTYEIEIIRQITDEERESDPERWEYYIGDSPTNAFETVEELVKVFREICNNRFQGEGWEFLVQSVYGDIKPLMEVERSIKLVPKEG